MKRFLWYLLCALSMMAVPATAQSTIERISVVAASDRAAPPSNLARAVQQALQQNWPNLAVDVTDKDHFEASQSSSTLIIAVGDLMLPWLAEHQRDYSNAIAFYVSSAAFAQSSKNNPKLTALYRDQPLSRQLELAKQLLPNLRHAAILRGDTPLPQNSAELEASSGIAITETNAAQAAEWPKLLAQVLHGNDVLLGIDDASIYNSETIRSILLTTYRNGKGVIGPSRTFVNAGSLASCYTSPDQYLQQLIAMATIAIREHRLPRAQYPAQFSVVINKQVATSLNLSIPDETTLSARLQHHREECGNGC